MAQVIGEATSAMNRLAAGTTDPRHWGVEVEGQLAHEVPHACFGLAPVGVFEVLEERGPDRSARGQG